MTRTKEEKIGVCMIGTGRAGMVHARNFANRISQCRLVALMDKDQEVAKERSQELGIEKYYTELEEALSDPAVEAVCIATPTFTHMDIAVAAADAGKHILCEKPLALDLEEADKMAQAVDKAGVTFMVGFMRRFDEGFKEAKGKIEAGEIGDPIVVKSTGRGPGLPPRWACNPDLSNGNLAEVNSHDFDAIRWLTGQEFESVFTRAGNFKTDQLKEDFPNFYDNAIVSFRMSQGILGTVDGSCPADYGYDARMEILGTKGVLFVGEVYKRGATVCTKEKGFTRSPVRSWRSLFKNAYIAEDKHFIQCLLEGNPPKSTLEDGRKAIEVVLAANNSLVKGEEVEF